MPSAMRWLVASLAASTANAITLEVSNADSIKSAAGEVAYGMMKYYTGNNTGDVPGNLPAPYYWWEAGAMFGEMVEYWYYTGDTTYVNETAEALIFQAGSPGDFMPANQSKDEGNDDQVFWAFAAMSAAELGFQDPPDSSPSWLSMAQAVFNEQASRWDTSTCGGGLRWQIFTFNNGYDYKNTVAEGGFFQLASRLARYTGNSTYVDWAEKMWDWIEDSVLYDNATFQVNDGTSTTQNCTSADHTQWSYNYGILIGGLAYIYNHTNDDKWMAPLEGLLNQTFETFFPAKYGNKIMVEVTCEPLGNCDNDERTFKAYVGRWLAVTMQLVPSLSSTILPYLQASAAGAAGQCSGGTDGLTCGSEWNTTVWSGDFGVGQQMSALGFIQGLMVNAADLKPPFTSDTGGTSKSNPSAGSADSSTSPAGVTSTITTGDRAGAGILTALVLAMLLGGAAWMVMS